jgi:Spy/CpxP family protein refolding chaperone
MRMNKTLRMALLIMLGLSAAALTAAAKWEPGEGSEGAESMPARMCPPGSTLAKELNLTTEQMEKLKTDDLAIEKQNIQNEAEMKMIHADIKGEVMKSSPDMGRLENLTRKMGDLHAKMMMTKIRHGIFFRDLLTPEQKRKMDQMAISGSEMGEGHKMMEMKSEHGK